MGGVEHLDPRHGLGRLRPQLRISLWQGIVAGVVARSPRSCWSASRSIAGKRGSAPTLTLSRAAFGMRGNVVPGVVSYLLLVGWEIALVAIATFASATVFTRLGWGGGNGTKVIAFLGVVAVIVAPASSASRRS